MWTYSQTTGKLTDPQGNDAGIGYSGNGADINDPAEQDERGHGPIPQGIWSIGDFFDDHGGKGPIVAHLLPVAGTETFGRSGFMIHGDNKAGDRSASEGCVILNHSLRSAIASSGDKT